MDFEKKERNLSASETVIMKAIWDPEEDLSVPNLINLLNTKYGKEYAKTTVVTFLLHLSDKEFATTYRKGRYSYVHALKSEKEYRQKLMREALDFWYKNDIVEMITCMLHEKKISHEEIQKIQTELAKLDSK